MKLLNPGGPRGRAIPGQGDGRPCRMIAIGGARVAIDPGTLACFALDDGEPPPACEPVEFQHPASALAAPRALCLSLTRECNLRCGYCYVQEARARTSPGGAETRVMTEKTICRALDLFAIGGRPRSPFRLSFFGGEPMLAWGRLRFAVERAEKLADFAGLSRPRFHVTTNGTLLEADRLDYLEAHGFSLIVSVDGPAEIHDRHRKYTAGAGSYAAVREGLSRIEKRPDLARRTTLRATWLPGQARIEERLEHLNELADLGSASWVSVEPAVGCEGCGNEEALFDCDEIVSALELGAAWCVERAREGKRARWHYLGKTLARLVKREPAPCECGAGWGYMHVGPEGAIHACHKEAGKVLGDVRWGLDEEARAPWRENRWYARPVCRHCWARNVCGGGCRALAAEDLTKPAHVTCVLGRSRARAAVYALAELADDADALGRLLPEGQACRTRSSGVT